jgi:hypothetical protein
MNGACVRPHGPVVLEVMGVSFEGATDLVRYCQLGEEGAKGLPEIRDADQ